MGTNILSWGIGNRLDIADVESEVQRIRRDLRTAGNTDSVQDEQIEILVRENAELKLYLSAVVRLLLQKEVVSRAELETIVKELDAEDGEVDGKYDGPIA